MGPQDSLAPLLAQGSQLVSCRRPGNCEKEGGPEGARSLRWSQVVPRTEMRTVPELDEGPPFLVPYFSIAFPRETKTEEQWGERKLG